jgi:hypothetical protein
MFFPDGLTIRILSRLKHLGSFPEASDDDQVAIEFRTHGSSVAGVIGEINWPEAEGLAGFHKVRTSRLFETPAPGA